jgi:hypothetical protein
MYDYIDTGVTVTPDLLTITQKLSCGDKNVGVTAKVTKISISSLTNLSADAEEALRMIEAMVDNNIVIHIEDMGVIDDSPAGKQLLNTIASVLG